MKYWHKMEVWGFELADEQAADFVRSIGESEHRWELDRVLNRLLIWVPYTNNGPRELINRIQREGYEVEYSADREVEEHDMQDALLFGVDVTRPITNSPDAPHNADWDLSRMCLECGSGAEPRGGMHLDESDIPKGTQIIWTDLEEFHVSAELKDHLDAEFGPLADLRQDVDARRRDQLLPWWYIHPTNTLPPMSPKSINFSRYCVSCENGFYGGDGRLTTPVVWIYELSEKEARSLPPFSRSFEYIGDSSLIEDERRRIRYSRQSILVNRACREFFLKHKVKHIEFWPIETRIVDR